MSLDTISLEDISIIAIIGVYPEERVKPQEIIVSVSLGLDLLPAGLSDDLSCTVDYNEIRLGIISAVQECKAQLIERVAELIAAYILSDRRIEQVTVDVSKPEAVRGSAKTARVVITRHQQFS